MFKLLKKASLPGILTIALLSLAGCMEPPPPVAETPASAAHSSSAAMDTAAAQQAASTAAEAPAAAGSPAAGTPAAGSPAAGSPAAGTPAAGTPAATPGSASPVLDRVLEEKVLKVGMSGDQPPMNARGRSGQILGYDVDLSRSLADSMGVRLKIETMPFSELLPALQAGKIDMVMSGMAITAQRSRDFTFVGPYMISGKSILTKSQELSRTHQSADFNNAELSLAALKGSTSQTFIENVAPEATLVTIANYDEGVAMVIDDRVDAMVADMPTCVVSLLRYPDAGLYTLKTPVSLEPFGIVVPLNAPQFAHLVENYLDSYSKMGVLRGLRKKWFEDKSWIAALP